MNNFSDILWRKTTDPAPDRTPVLCHCSADDSVFLGFCIHPYLDLDRTQSITNWYKITGIHQWERVDKIVTEWANFFAEVIMDYENLSEVTQ